MTEQEGNDDDTTQQKERLEIVKVDDDWLIGEEHYLAQEDVVSNLIKEVCLKRKIDLVSERGSEYKYDLDETNRITVELYSDQNKLVRKIHMGKKSSVGNHVYLQQEDDKAIYQAIDSLTSVMDVDVDSLREKDIFSFTASTVKGLEVGLADGKKVLISETEETVSQDDKTDAADTEETNKGGSSDNNTSKEIVWKDTEGVKYDDGKIKKIISVLSSLKCELFLDEKVEVLKEQKIQRTLSVTAGTQTYTLFIMKEGYTDPQDVEADAKEKQQKTQKVRVYIMERKYGFVLSEQDGKVLIEVLKDLYKKEAS